MSAPATESFVMLPCRLMDEIPRNVRAHTMMVYSVLHRRGWHSDQGCWAAVSSLSEDSGVGEHSVRAAIRWLLDAGWIVKEERPGYTSVYRIEVSKPKPRASQRKRSATTTENRRGPLANRTGDPLQNRKTNHIPLTRSP